MAFVLGDAAANGLQGLAQGTGGLALALAGVDLNPLEARQDRLTGLLLEGRGIGAPVGAHLRVEVGNLHQGARSAPTGDDHLHAGGLGREGAHHLLGIQQAEIQHGVELIEHHHRIELAGDGPLGDGPTPLGLLHVHAGDLIGAKKFAAAGADLVDQMGETLLQGFDRRVFVVGATGPLQKTQQQHPGLLLLADAQANGPQDDPEGRLTFAFAFAVVDVNLAATALAAIGGGSDPNAASGAATSAGRGCLRSHRRASYRWILTRVF